ncbi:response regulator [Flavisolibacter nicotianae]|uniref:response regulator n=1 Tax=Flavisolibacter nicotianae TaxID=2364882 RepID=UPI000EB3C189|nr:response regulator [Flavisolibacter nicotianae]
MARESVILYIDDDPDDHDLIQLAFAELGVPNEVVCLHNGEDAFRYLQAEEPPFLILCDYKLPGMDGIELRRKIEDHEELRKKAIPFIFLSTTVSRTMVQEVYTLNVQGLFEKGNLFESVKSLLKLIYDYWQTCKHPNN